MNFDFTKIQNQMYKYLVEQKKINPKENGEIDLSALYALLNMSAPPADLNTPEGTEYLKDLVEEFMELEYIIKAADDDKNNELSVTEKGDFMNEELDLDLTAEQLEELFGPEEVETPPPSGGDGGGGGGGGGGGDDKGDNDPPPGGGDEEVTGDAKVQKAKDDMDAAEDVYQDAIAELMENDPAFAALEQDRLATNEQIAAQEEENTALETESQELDVEITRLGSEISACQTEIESIQSDIDNVPPNEDGTPGDTSALQTKLDEAKQRKADLEADKKAAEDRKKEIDGTLLPNGVQALEELNTHLTEVETEIATTLKEKDEKASTAFKDYTEKKDKYEAVKAEYDAEQEKIREQELNEEKAQYLEKDKKYDSLSDVLLDGSAVSDEIKKSVEEVKFDENTETSYSIGTNGNYSVTGIKDGQEVTIYYDSEGKEVSRKSTDADVILADRASGINSSIREELGLSEDTEMPSIEYELNPDGKVVATVEGKGSFVINKDGEVVGRPLNLVSEETAETDAEKQDAKALKAIEAELGDAISEASSVSYEKTDNGYIITAVGADGKETTYTYGMKENEDKTKTPVLESSSDASAIIKSADNPELAKEVMEDVATILGKKGQEGTDLEYKIVDGQIVVTSTFGGKDTTYKFDEEGKFISSSDARDVVENKEAAKKINAILAKEEADYSVNVNEDGTISATIEGTKINFDMNGSEIDREYTSLEAFMADVAATATKEDKAEFEGVIKSLLEGAGLKLDDGVTYKSDSRENKVSFEGSADGKKVEYVIDLESGAIIGSPNLNNILKESDETKKMQANVTELFGENANVNYRLTSDGVEATVTGSDGKESTLVFNNKGEVISSSSISHVGGENDALVQSSVKTAAEGLHPGDDELLYQRNDDGSYTVISNYGGVENQYTFAPKEGTTEVELKSTSDLKRLTNNDEEAIKNISSELRSLGLPSNLPFEKSSAGGFEFTLNGEDGSTATFKFDKEGNLSQFDNLAIVYGDENSTKISKMITDSGYKAEGASYSFDKEGNLIVNCQDQNGKNSTIKFDDNWNIVASTSPSSVGLKEEDTAESLAAAGITDTSNCTYEISESGILTVTNVQDGVETTYTFDKEGNMTGYQNAIGSFELKVDGEKTTVVYEPAGGGKSVTLNVDNLSEAAKMFTPEQLKDIQSQTEALETAEGSTNASRIANSMGINPSEDNTYISSQDLYDEMIDVEEVQAGDVMFVSNETGDGYNVSVVAKVIETPEGGKAYVTIETDGNGNTKYIVKTPNEETDYCFKRQGNG